MTTNRIEAVRLVRNSENVETSGIQDSSVANFALCRVINKQTRGVTGAKVLFSKINLKKEQYIMLKKKY